MKKLLPLIAVSLCFNVAVVSAQQAPNRIALVIGNAEYKEGIAPLKNPANDASDIAKLLDEKLGFKVMKVVNGSFREMEEKIRQFAQESKQASVRFFYYAGHGVQFEGENYLLPVDTGQLAAEYEIKQKAVGASLVQDALSAAGDGVNILVMDSCRDNPFRSTSRSAGASRGLTVMGNIKGTYIAYATDPGKTAADGDGRNGVFTKALLGRLDQPGKSIDEIMTEVTYDVQQATDNKQTPWKNSSLSTMFYFVTPEQARAKFAASLSEKENELKGIESELEQLKSKLNAESDLAKKQNLDIELQKQISLKTQKQQEKDRLSAEKARQEEAERAKARELAEQVRFKEQQSSREEAIRAAAEKRRRELESIRAGSGTAVSLITTVTSTRDARLEIEKEYRESLKKVLLQITDSYAAKIDECMKAQRFPWESDKDLQDRIRVERNRLESERMTQINSLSKESETKRLAAAKPFWDAEVNTMENLQSQKIVYKGNSVKLEFGEFNNETKVFPITLSSTLPELPFSALLNYSIFSASINEVRDRYLEFDGYIKNKALYGEIETSIVTSGDRFVIIVDGYALKAILPSGDKVIVENRNPVPAGVFSSALDRDKPAPVSNGVLIEAPGADVKVDGESIGRHRCYLLEPSLGHHVVSAFVIHAGREIRNSFTVQPGLNRLVIPTAAPALMYLANAKKDGLDGLGLFLKSSAGTVDGVDAGEKGLLFRVPSGKDDEYTLLCPYADSVAELRVARKLKEDQRLQITVPVGYFSVPWLPQYARVSLVGNTRIDAGMQGRDGGYISRSLPEGKYSVLIEGSRRFSGTVQIKAGTGVELGGFREQMIAELEKEYEDVSQLSKQRTFYDIVGYASLGLAAASAYMMADSFFKGKDMMDAYNAAVTTSAATDARAEAEKYNTSFLAWAGVGAGGALFAPFVMSRGPKGPETKKRLDSVRNDLQLLRNIK